MGVGLLGDSWVPGTAGTIADDEHQLIVFLERTWAILFDSSKTLNASEPATFFFVVALKVYDGSIRSPAEPQKVS
jgi:hypothetical protein